MSTEIKDAPATVVEETKVIDTATATPEQLKAELEKIRSDLAKTEKAKEDFKRDMLTYKQEKLDYQGKLTAREVEYENALKAEKANAEKAANELKQLKFERVKEAALTEYRKEFGGHDLPKAYDSMIKGESEEEIKATAKEAFKTFTQDFKLRKGDSNSPIDINSKHGIVKPAGEHKIKPLHEYKASELGQIQKEDPELFKQIMEQPKFGNASKSGN